MYDYPGFIQKGKLWKTNCQIAGWYRILFGLYFDYLNFILLYKSDNRQYNTMVCWVDGKNDSLTKCLMFQVLFFFIISCKFLCKNCFNFFFYNFTKIKSFECPKSIRNYEKKKCLEHQTLGQWVVCSIDPASQRITLKIVGFIYRMELLSGEQ